MIADQIRCGRPVVQILLGAMAERTLVKIFMQLMLVDIYQRMS